MRGFFKLLAWALLVVSLFVAAVGGIGYAVYRDATGPGPLAQSRRVVVPPHTGLAEIAALLAKSGVIRHPLPFEIAAVTAGRGGGLLAGQYEFPAEISPLGVIDLLASGKTVKYRLTIPEGLTSAEVTALVRAAPALDGDPGTPPADGVLMPETYVYSYGDKRTDMLGRMRHAMARELAETWAGRRPGLPLADPQQMLILASLVERETAHASERARIAAVFLNRLQLGIPLQSDPTVIYALSDGGTKPLDRPLTRADLALASPYNTYLRRGLPPGPIDNPGAAALRAAAHPALSDDLYFVADGAGGHVFAKTLSEHNRNVAEYRRGQPTGLDPPDPERDGAVRAEPGSRESRPAR